MPEALVLTDSIVTCGGPTTSISTALPAVCPAGEEVDVALRDGSSLHIRPVRDADRAAIRTFFQRLSGESRSFRFFGAPNLDWVTNWSVDVDYADRYALVATTGPDRARRLRADRSGARRGGVRRRRCLAGRGIATIMLGHLAAAAEQHEIALFVAQVMPENHRMVDVFRDSGFAVTVRAIEGMIEIELPTSLSDEARQRFHEREQVAAVAAVRGFLRPRSVAVIGASRRPRTIGAEVFNNLISGRFIGPVHAINLRAQTIQGCRAYASIADVAEPVELAVVAVPAVAVNDVAHECGACGVRALLVISAGFAEAGTDGVRRQQQLLATCREAGMRLIGPNSVGVLNTDRDVRLDATFAAHAPPRGNVGFFSQSGGLGIAMLEAAGRLGLGLSSFVSVGDKADVSGNDLLEYWEQDPATDVILFYAESFGDPRRFARIARRVGAKKPIVAIKSGRSPAGTRATSSHTGALISASDVTVDALFRQAGVVRVDTTHELFDVAAMLSAQPVPHGARVAIVTNATGPGILCADACQANELDVVDLSDEVRRELSEFLAPEASIRNPIDMIATAPAGHYRRVIEVLVARNVCDAIIAIFVPPLVTVERDVSDQLVLAAQRTGDVTLASVLMDSSAGPLAKDGERAIRLPRFEFPEDAARAVAHAARYARWRQRPTDTVSRRLTASQTR